MNIEITRNEYRELLDILHISDVVMFGHRRHEDKRTEKHRALIQKLYALAQGEALDQLISYDESVKKYLPTDEFERNALAHVVLNEFADHLFWDELISRLSVRDAAQIAGGIEHLNSMNESDRQTLERSIRQRYIQEFSANGIANVAVIEQFSTGGAMPAETSD